MSLSQPKKIKFVIKKIKKCAICDKRLGRYDGKYEMEVVIHFMINKNFEPYSCCGMCALDRVKQRDFMKFKCHS